MELDYPLENLGDTRFQLMCQALLAKKYSGVKCYPVDQPDGGRDATRTLDASSFVVYQIKFTREGNERDRRNWLNDIIEGEIAKIQKLVERGATEYVLISNVPGTAHLDSGSIDKLENELKANLGIRVTCWWRNDINRLLDDAIDIKLHYPEVLSGHDMLALLVRAREGADSERRRNAIKAFMADQYEEDREVKFKQARLVEEPSRFIHRSSVSSSRFPEAAQVSADPAPPPRV